MNHRAILSFDPGSRGVAIAASLEHDRAKLFELRFVKGKDHRFLVDRKALSAAFSCFRSDVNPLVVIEAVHGRGGWSAQSNFSFGSTVGAIVALANEKGFRTVSVVPQTWQGVVHDPDVNGDPKLRSLEAYCRLFPHDPLPRRKGEVNHNAVDALLIAWWGARYLSAPTRAWRFS